MDSLRNLCIVTESIRMLKITYFYRDNYLLKKYI
nr:MAG TPA: hypothetical protein [Bacteriophage sp.]